MSNTAVIQLHQREIFERNVTRAVVAGAGAGLVAFIGHRLHVPVPIAFLAVSAAALACIRADGRERLALAGFAVVLPALPWLFSMAAEWTVGLAGAIAGALVVKFRWAEKGPEGSVAAARPTVLNLIATALATGVLAVAGAEVAQIIALRLRDLATPEPLRWAMGGAVVALFAGLGSLASHIALGADPVEAACEEGLKSLTGEFHTLGLKALGLYRGCGEVLAALPRDPSREELARTVQTLTKSAFELAVDWAGVEAQLHDNARQRLQAEATDLAASAAVAKDPIARAQLDAAAASLREELVRLDDLVLKRERVVAKFKGLIALLERARVALIGMRSAHASVRAAEMSAVARKLNALALSQADESQLAHAVATNAELGAQETEASDRALRETMQAVAPVGPESAGATAAQTKDPASS